MLVKKTASCVQMLEWCEANKMIVDFPLPGDMVFFKYPTNDRRTNHIGLVTNVNSLDDYATNEGNTSLTSNDNGGAVMSRKRSRKNLVAFARPRFSNKDQINRLMAIASGEVGTTEYPPNSNCVKYNTWFYGRVVTGKKYPWCCTYISWLFNTLDIGEDIITSKPVLRLGSTGSDVRLLQELLALKSYILKPDGQFGPLTQGMVKNFQRANGLTDDGIVGPKTWNLLLN